MTRPSHLTAETDRFFTDGSSALAVDFLPPEPPDEPKPPHLHAVPDLPPEQTSVFLDAEMVPELREKRQQAAQKFADILSQKRELIFNGEADKVNEQIDALGTAKHAVEARRKFGKNSPEYREKRAATRLDSARLIYEAASKNSTEYFEELERIFTGGNYYSNGMSLAENVETGITPKAHPEEVERQGKEIAEEGTYEGIGELIKSLGLEGAIEYLAKFLPSEPELTGEDSISVTTHSMVAQYAVEAYKLDPKGNHGGYSASPDVMKMMIRKSHFRDNSGNRYDEVAAVKGPYFDEDLMNEVFADTSVMAIDSSLNKTEILGTQRISINSGSVHEDVRLLDEKAGAKYGVNLFRGEVVPADHPKDYEAFEEQARIRQKKFEPMPDQLADFLESLVEADTPTEVANAQVTQFLKNQLLELSETRPEIAAMAFDAETAQGFHYVAQLRRAGRFDDAQMLLEQVKNNAPDPVFCGGGGGGGRWLIEQMLKMAKKQSGEQLNEQELAEEDGEDKYGPLSFYCKHCGQKNTRTERHADGTFEFIENCKSCDRSTRC